MVLEGVVEVEGEAAEVERKRRIAGGQGAVLQVRRQVRRERVAEAGEDAQLTLAALPAQTEAVDPSPYPASTPSPVPGPGTVSGAVCYPSEFIPAMTGYLQNAETGALVEFPIAENQTSYSVALEPGTYIAFAYLPGGQLGGMYSAAVDCGLGVECTDHTPIMFTVEAGSRQERVDLCDWYDQDSLPPIPQQSTAAGLIYAQPVGGSLYQVDESGSLRPVTTEPGARISPDGQIGRGRVGKECT